MKIELEVSARSTKRILVIASGLATIVAASVAFASPAVFGGNDVLTATALNNNFEDLDKRIAGLETGKPTVAVGGQAYTLGATYVGTGADTQGKIQLAADTGYVAARKICQSIDPKSATAHMCDNAELVRSAQLGLQVPIGWYSTGVNSPDGDDVRFRVNDCRGWTQLTNPNDAQREFEGGLWSNGPSNDVCKNPHPILCCD